MENESESGPEFLDHRWAACSNVGCGHFNRTYRCEVPIRPCRLCKGKMRTPKWKGWKTAKLERLKVVQEHLARGEYPGPVLEYSGGYRPDEQARAEADERDRREG